MPENISPEEKLLNLIKGSKEPAEKKEIPSQVEETSSAGREKESGPKEDISKTVPRRRKGLVNPFPLLNRFLVLGMLGLLVYMVLGYIYPYKSETEIP